ncbi:MAG: hypothetical protein LR015_09690 [Verrucomicrobia bacterium]|nr:hypothetical protein [Verrucomicrobiota bacterium]
MIEVDGVQHLPPFMMILTSDRDHWMFINSDGSFTCGRRNPDHALLPYYTQDKLQDMRGSSGSFSALKISGSQDLWMPFGVMPPVAGTVERVLRKSDMGDTVELQETHLEWGLRWSICYRSSGRLGIVRSVTCENISPKVKVLEVVDGLRNILCPGIEARFQNEFSCLGDAYKQASFDHKVRMGLYSLSSLPTDLASPMEALRANVVWAVGAEAAEVTLASEAGEHFIQGRIFQRQHNIRGQRLAYLLHHHLELAPGENKTWHLCADLDYDVLKVEQRCREIVAGKWPENAVLQACAQNAERLRARLLQADGIQVTNHQRGDLRHLSNSLFNIMRGGALPTGYTFPVNDLKRTIRAWNKEASTEFEAWVGSRSGLDLFTVQQSAGLSPDLTGFCGNTYP